MRSSRTVRRNLRTTSRHHFQRELLPPPRAFYEKELGTLSRPDRKGWASAICPFHRSHNTRKPSRNFWVHLDSGGFNCFGCGVHGGDVVSFIQQREHLTFKEAAQRLGAWDSAPSPETVRKLNAQARERERQRQIEAEREAELHRERMSLRQEIYVDVALHKEAAARLNELHNGANPATPDEEDMLWSIMSLALTDLRLSLSRHTWSPVAWSTPMPAEKNNGGIHLDFDESPTAAPANIRRFADDAWRKHLIYTVAKDGTVGGPKPILANVVTALRFAPEWSSVLAHNEFSLHVTTQKPAPWQTDAEVGKNWTDYEDSRTCEWMQREGIYVRSQIAAEAVQTVAKENPFHPVRDYLQALEWDGQPRVDEWLIRYLGAEDTLFVRAVSARWLISAIARICRPGCQVDHVLLLEGAQGIRKSSSLRGLVGDDYFTDHTAELGSKDSRLDLSGKWVVEIAELDKVRRGDLERVKAFLVARIDHFRVPYGRRSEDVKRSCVFAATVNDQTPLTDETGNRRFWPVHCGQIDIEGLTAARDQLWAEAYSQYMAGKVWWLDTVKLNDAAAEEQEKRFDSGVWDDVIISWLDDPQQRYERDRDQEIPILPFDSTREEVTITDVLLHAIGKPLDRCTQGDKNQVARCLVHNGWQRKQWRSGPRRGKWFYAREGAGEPVARNVEPVEHVQEPVRKSLML